MRTSQNVFLFRAYTGNMVQGLDPNYSLKREGPEMFEMPRKRSELGAATRAETEGPLLLLPVLPIKPIFCPQMSATVHS